MTFSDSIFLLLYLPVSLAIYWIFRRRVFLQNIVLLTEGLLFYACINWRYVLILMACVLITFFTGRSGNKKLITVGLILNFLSLAFFKYAGTFAEGIVLPIGMSFYIFQATGYLFDVYREKYEGEKDFISIALFLCFMPVITAGPILRWDSFCNQIKQKRKLSFYDFQRAVMIFSYGLFLKLVIADRIGVLVDTIFGSYRNYSGQILFIGAVGYSIQIYADFAGYSYMAIAIAMAYGLVIPDNFRQPYFSLTVADFWRRWHITLSTWLKDYIYIPLGGNRCGRKRKYINIMITFFISGLWHGAGLNFVCWGLLHGVCNVMGDVFGNTFRKMGKTRLYRMFRGAVVFLVVTILWVFFRAESLVAALSYIKRLLFEFRPWELTDGTLFTLGIDGWHMFFLFIFIVMAVMVSWFREKGLTCSTFCKQNVVVKCLGFLTLAFIIVCFGNYGPGYESLQFIYAGF